MNTKSKKLNLLICGSQKFEDQSFVYGMLNQLNAQTNFSITDVYTSNFSGACRFARNWIGETNDNYTKIDTNIALIKHHDCNFDMHIAENNLSFYEEADLPSIVIQNDPFFKKGKELLIENGINMVLAFPNMLGQLGAATRNIQRFAELGDVPFLNGVQAYELLKDIRKESVITSSNEEFIGLKNQHGMKK